MWIEHTGGVKFLSPDSDKITLAMTNPAGSVAVEQMGIDKDDWFPYKSQGISADLNSDNTAVAVYGPIKLRVTATGTGVRLYHRKLPNKRPVVIRN